MPEAEGMAPLADARRVLIVAGEASGDRYGAGLMEAVLRIAPGVTFRGIGGEAMRGAGLDSLMDAERIAVMGFFEVLGSLPVIRRAFRLCEAELSSASRPDLVLLIDYPGFNLRLARAAHRAGVPVVYFVSPQVWAWKPGRVRLIAETVSRMLVIFPFEESFYRDHGVPVTYVGHPMLDVMARRGLPPSREKVAGLLGIDPSRRIVGLLPGSRLKEIRRNLPPMIGAARELASRHADLEFVVPVASTLRREEVASRIDLPGVHVIEGNFHDALGLCEVAVVSSGTATMEAGLLQVPMVIVYRLNPMTYAVARRLTHLDTFGMVNLVAGRRIVPELIQSDCTPAGIAAELDRLLTDRVLYERTRRELRSLRELLGGEGAFQRAAAAVVEALRAKPR